MTDNSNTNSAKNNRQWRCSDCGGKRVIILGPIRMVTMESAMSGKEEEVDVTKWACKICSTSEVIETSLGLLAWCK